MESILLNLIPPALILSILAYFVSFFGKVIADQQPFTDDRKWHIQIAGATFVLNIVFGSTVGVFLANTIPFGMDSWWSHVISLLILSFIGTALLFHGSHESSRLYNYKKHINAEVDKKLDGLPSVYAKIGRFVFPALVPVVVSYSMTLEYLSGNWYLIVITAIISFYIFVWSAFQYSLRKMEEIALVDIYFTDKEHEPVRDAQILKVNDDNIRVRVSNTILILNKSEVFKIEMRIPEKFL